MNKQILIGLCMLVILGSVVIGAKGFSVAGYSSAPILSLELITNGDLEENQTYYYRAMTSSHSTPASGSSYRSAPSLIYEIETNSTHRGVNITITHPTGNAEYVYIWSINATRPDYGDWNRADLYPQVYKLASRTTTSIHSTKEAKINYFEDTGSGWRIATNMLGNTNNYGYMYLYEHGQDYITITGGTTSEPITIDEIYIYAVENGWNLSSTIQRFDYGVMGLNNDRPINKTSSAGVDDLARPTYLINANKIVYSNCVFRISDCVVISKMSGMLASVTDDCEIQMGDYNSDMNFSYNGVEWVSIGHGTQFNSLSMVNAKIYDSKFVNRKNYGSTSLLYGATFDLYTSENNWFTLKDTKVGDGWSTGMSISTTNVNPNSSLERVDNFLNRWESVSTSDMNFSINEWNFYQRDTGAWIRPRQPIESLIRGLNVNSLTSSGSALYISINATSHSNYYSRLSLINPYIYNWDRLYWYMSGTQVGNFSYVKRIYTLEINTHNQKGLVVENVNITIQDKNNNTMASVLTGSNGNSGEIEIIHTYYYQNESKTSSYYNTQTPQITYYPYTITMTHPDYLNLTRYNYTIESEQVWDVLMVSESTISSGDIYIIEAPKTRSYNWIR